MKKILDLQNASCIFYTNSNSKKNLLGFFELKFCPNWSELPEHFDFFETLRSLTKKFENFDFLIVTHE
jgi:hypothetical protein